LSTPEFEFSSGFWNKLSKEHIEKLVENGFDYYQQTIARRAYWAEKFLDAAQLQTLIAECSSFNLKVPIEQVFKQYPYCPPKDSIQYHIMDLLLLKFVIDNGLFDLLRKIVSNTSLVGSPIHIQYDGINITQEDLNTTLEIATLMKRFTDFAEVNHVLEVGAGSGRTAKGLLRIKPGIKYIIVDIPPALFISQENLIREFSDLKAKRFDGGTNSKSLSDVINKFDLIFLMPDQVKFLPEQSVDLFIAIDCLHEMTPKMINRYFEVADHISKNIYFKCWNVQRATTSSRLLGFNDYPVKQNWKRIFHEECGVPNEYFHALYATARPRSSG